MVGSSGKGMEAYHVTGGVIYRSQCTPCVFICRAQISLLFFLAAYFLRDGRVADAFDDAAYDGDVAGDIFRCGAI